MFAKTVSMLLCLVLLGGLTPTWAEDSASGKPPVTDTGILASPAAPAPALVARTLLFPSPVALAAAGMPRYHFDAGDQSQAGQNVAKGELTTAGKVLKWVGLGLIASGAAEMVVGATMFKDDKSCSSGSGYGYSYSSCYSLDNSAVRKVYYASGGISIGTGVVLMLIGNGKRQ